MSRTIHHDVIEHSEGKAAFFAAAIVSLAFVAGFAILLA